MNIASLNFTLSRICMKSKVPSKAKIKDTSIFCRGVAVVKTIIDTRIPSLAESKVPAVVGETNLFLLNCCMIKPTILMLIPAIIILINRGTLLTSKTCFCVSVKLNKSSGLTLETPTNTESSEKTNKSIIKYRIFIDCPSLQKTSPFTNMYGSCFSYSLFVLC